LSRVLIHDHDYDDDEVGVFFLVICTPGACSGVLVLQSLPPGTTMGWCSGVS
jgi:hypothetical protein